MPTFTVITALTRISAGKFRRGDRVELTDRAEIDRLLAQGVIAEPDKPKRTSPATKTKDSG